MKTTIKSSAHTFEIDGNQIDLFYFFHDCTIQIFIEGELIYNQKFQPGRIHSNYVNLIDVTVRIYEQHLKTKNKKPKQESHALE